MQSLIELRNTIIAKVKKEGLTETLRWELVMTEVKINHLRFLFAGFIDYADL